MILPEDIMERLRRDFGDDYEKVINTSEKRHQPNKYKPLMTVPPYSFIATNG